MMANSTVPPEVSAEQRLDALSDADLLAQLASLCSGVLTRVTRYDIEGLDPDYPDRPPELAKLYAGLAFAAKAESVADHFLAGPSRCEDGTLTGWDVGLHHLRNVLAWECLCVEQGQDPRPRDA